MVCTALALALFFDLIREVGPQRALVITFVNPAVAVLLGVLLLDEPFTLGLAVGLPLVLVGCVLATRRSPARSAASELRGRRRPGPLRAFRARTALRGRGAAGPWRTRASRRRT